jgi:tryptophan 2,3-dioxygenase
MGRTQTTQKGSYIVIATLVLICIGELVIDLVYAQKVHNYDWQTQTLSYLGSVNSLILSVIEHWDVLFTFTAYEFYHTFVEKAPSSKLRFLCCFTV